MSVLRQRYFRVASILLLFGIFAACSGESAVEPTGNSAGSFGISNPHPKVGGPIAPSFTVNTGGGSTFSLDEHGGEVEILYFSFPG